MKNIDYFVLGLGNPGSKYKNTRHNIGWMCAESLINKYSGKIEKISQLAYYSHIKIQNKNILVAMPLTYMNNSGEAAKYFLDKFKLQIENIIIIVDEYNFPTGKIHIKSGGGDGGHNGTNSVIKELSSNNFYKLRCGIDKNFGNQELVDYVLSPFTFEELATLKIMIENSILALEYFITNNKSLSMSMINSGNLFFKKDKNNSN